MQLNCPEKSSWMGTDAKSFDDLCWNDPLF